MEMTSAYIRDCRLPALNITNRNKTGVTDRSSRLKHAYAYTHPPMAARTKNIILKSLLDRETSVCRPSVAHIPPQTLEKPRLENDAWCIIAADGSKSIISCKPALNKARSGGLNPPMIEEQAKKSQNRGEYTPDPPEPGVDLSYLNAENEAVSKVIAGMKAMALDKAAAPSEHEIEMPSAKTDLKEIFKSDNICMVNLPKTAAAQSK
jgi:hypothetical protein